MTLEEAKAALEAVLFSTHIPLSASQLAEVLELDKKTVEALLAQLMAKYKDSQYGIWIYAVAGGFIFGTKPEFHEYIKRLHQPVVRSGLSQAGLETLAVIAYKQPCTKADIESIRGVSVDSVITSLLDRGLIAEVGRKDAPGRPILYGTTQKFLVSFGINSLDDLPELPEKTLLQLQEIAAASDN